MNVNHWKENVLLASINVILGADSEAKQAGAIASPGFDDKKDRVCTWLTGARETDLVSEAGPYGKQLRSLKQGADELGKLMLSSVLKGKEVTSILAFMTWPQGGLHGDCNSVES